MKPVLEWMLEQPDKKWSLSQWIGYEIPINGRQNSYRHFGPFADFKWAQAYFSKTERGPDRAEREGEDVFIETFADSIQDGFNGWFDFSRFKGINGNLTFVAKITEGTMNTDEGRLSPNSLQPEDVASLNEWIGSFMLHDSSKYGFNLLNNNPYFYYSRSFWRKKSGLPTVISNTRIRTFSKLRFDRPGIEEELVFPFGMGTRVSSGLKFYPTAFDEAGWKPSFTVKFTHQLRRGVINGNVLYGAIQINEKERLYLIGVNLNSLWIR